MLAAIRTLAARALPVVAVATGDGAGLQEATRSPESPLAEAAVEPRGANDSEGGERPSAAAAAAGTLLGHPDLPGPGGSRPAINWKSRLNEWLQRRSRPPLDRGAYETTRHGPAHAPYFRCSVTVPGFGTFASECGGLEFAQAKLAQQDAARRACESIDGEVVG